VLMSVYSMHFLITPQLLARDQHRCPITHVVDEDSPHITEQDDIATLEAAQIIPFSINKKVYSSGTSVTISDLLSHY